ncbi:MAG: hypothetical protein Fur007_00290 [Rhodoferax sp.]
MNPAPPVVNTALAPGSPQPEPSPNAEIGRLWLGFMTARATLGCVLAGLQVLMVSAGHQHDLWPVLVCMAYAGVALVVRMSARPQALRDRLDWQWLRSVGIDVLTFGTLQLLQDSNINYAPLLALPVLMAAVLGSSLMAMTTAAAITLLLFAYAGWMAALSPTGATLMLSQAALTGSGCFAIAFLASQVAGRLASTEQRARHSQLATQVQRQVNALVISSMSDGVLVVDREGWIQSANPAACTLLGLGSPSDGAPMANLGVPAAWQALHQLVHNRFTHSGPVEGDLSLALPKQSPRRLLVRTQLTAPLGESAQTLCVVFLQDQRALQARVRAEKLASMGRMSAAVAHEIRNPLAAITQANALLAEDLTDPTQQRLAQLVAQNAQRLETIVQEVLHLAHVPDTEPPRAVALVPQVHQTVHEWLQQHPQAAERLMLQLPPQSQPSVRFDAGQLRRVLINLLDNAQRYASAQPGAIQVTVDTASRGVQLEVWSDSAPLDASVEQHLFEPFFSSESRSSGLGLYICRELCEAHGASLSYQRVPRLRQAQSVEGNAFVVAFQSLAPHPAATGV